MMVVKRRVWQQASYLPDELFRQRTASGDR
jgi:hypothetical protein